MMMCETYNIKEERAIIDGNQNERMIQWAKKRVWPSSIQKPTHALTKKRVACHGDRSLPLTTMKRTMMGTYLLSTERLGSESREVKSHNFSFPRKWKEEEHCTMRTIALRIARGDRSVIIVTEQWPPAS